MNLTILKTQADLDNWRDENQNEKTIFVPTMGGLHRGHQELIRCAKKLYKKKTSRVLVSIFINPLQFGPGEDLKKYPRALEKDCELAYEAGASAIWAPDFRSVFPNGKEGHFSIQAPNSLTKELCGSFREGHFNGVSTVLVRLLSLVRPDRMFLGEKDWQQLVIAKQLVSEIGLSVKIHSIATVREDDGLPCSTRNFYLSKKERSQAAKLPEILSETAEAFKKNKRIDLNKLKSSLNGHGLKVQYLQSVDYKKLSPVNLEQSRLCLLAAAVHCGETRLIDHTFLMKRNPIVAIDGPAGAGKSTVTKEFAKKLGLIYLDTGAMYRAVTWLSQEKGIEPENEKELSNAIQNIKLDIQLKDDGTQQVLLNKQDITNKIRSPKVTAQVSLIAAQNCVRAKLTAQQQELGKKGGLVAEGRDIGTAVFPDAEVKIFLTATAQERAMRRSLDMKKQGFKVPELSILEEEINKRDFLDSTRKIAPLLKAKDAKELITDGMSIEAVIESLVCIFRDEIPEEVWPTPVI